MVTVGVDGSSLQKNTAHVGWLALGVGGNLVLNQQFSVS